MWKKSNIYDQSVAGYDAYIRKIIPVYDKMHSIIREMLLSKYQDRKISTIIELGVGTGMLAFQILSEIKIKNYIGYENSKNLASLAKSRLNLFSSSVDIRTEDFRTAAFRPSDAVVSTMTMHYLANNQKKEIFKKIYMSFKKDGIIIIGDRVISKGRVLQTIFKERMYCFWDETTKNWQKNIRRQHNTVEDAKEEPWYLDEQLLWLKEVGFSEADCIWRDFNYCVFYGIKSGR